MNNSTINTSSDSINERNDMYCTIPNCTHCTNIRTARINASAHSINEGNAWYATTGTWMNEASKRTNKQAHIIAAVYAAFSINTKWALNKKHAETFIDMYINGTHREFTGTLGMNIRKAIAYIEQDTHDFNTMVKDANNYKIRNFTCNLTNDCIHDIECVTIDRWAHRIATAFADCNDTIANKHSCGHVPTGTEYIALAKCYRTVAKEFNETARTLQAITWIEFAGGVED
jgi:hypothetical protein